MADRDEFVQHSTPMEPALETLLDGVIDYAGLFPPAKLEMEDAVREYLAHLGGSESLILNRFVCPCSRLDALGDVLAKLAPDVLFSVAAIGTSIGAVAEDRQAIDAYAKRFGAHFEVEAYEVRSGTDVPLSLRGLKPVADLDVYLEIPLTDHTNEDLHAIADAGCASAKARTGGLDSTAFPSPERLANLLRECLDLNLPFKLTAGLHHPIRTHDPLTGGMMHGFLNVLIALTMAEEHELNRSEIAEILADEHPHSFVVNGNQVGYKELRADLESIGAIRTLFGGFGSCSVREPIADLQALGLW